MIKDYNFNQKYYVFSSVSKMIGFLAYMQKEGLVAQSMVSMLFKYHNTTQRDLKDLRRIDQIEADDKAQLKEVLKRCLRLHSETESSTVREQIDAFFDISKLIKMNKVLLMNE